MPPRRDSARTRDRLNDVQRASGRGETCTKRRKVHGIRHDGGNCCRSSGISGANSIRRVTRSPAGGRRAGNGAEEVVRATRRDLSGSTWTVTATVSVSATVSASASATLAINNRGNPAAAGEIGEFRRKHGTLPSNYSRVSPSPFLILAVRRKLFDQRTLFFFFRARERLPDFAPISILNRDAKTREDPLEAHRLVRAARSRDRSRSPVETEAERAGSLAGRSCKLGGVRRKQRKRGRAVGMTHIAWTQSKDLAPSFNAPLTH